MSDTSRAPAAKNGRSATLVGLGVSALDVVALVDRLPDTEAVQPAHDLALAGGGPVATACAAAAMLGCRTMMIDVLGDDWIGTEIVKAFDYAGVDCSRVRRVSGARSPMAAVWVENGSGNRAIAFHAGAAPELVLEQDDRSAIMASKCLHVNGRHWPTCLEAAIAAREAGALVSFDGGAGRYRHDLRQLVALADVCIVAAPFAQELTGVSGAENQLRALRARAPGVVGVTYGELGSWIAAPEEQPFHQPALAPRQLVDTTGCGDAYHGAFLYGLLDGRSVQDAARLASAVAALSAGALGGRAGLPNLVEAEAFLRDCRPPPTSRTASKEGGGC